MTPGSPLVEVTRRDTRGTELVESVHSGHLVVAGADGALAAIGDPDEVVFVRSTAKPLQATACLELLDVTGIAPSDAEVAVAWSSHRAEPLHVAAVQRLLHRSGTRPQDLTCPPSPSDADPGATPARILHNCSGKHALFALAGREIGCPPERLLDPDGPLQRFVLGVLAEALGPTAAVGVDGCGAPAVTATLAVLARAYGQLAVDRRYARVRQAGFAHPQLVGGSGRLESALLDAGIVAKPGAEGVFAAGWAAPDGSPRGLAVKIADGAARAACAAVWLLLADLRVVPGDRWSPPVPLGGGRPAGVVRTAGALNALAEGLLAPG